MNLMKFEWQTTIKHNTFHKYILIINCRLNVCVLPFCCFSCECFDDIDEYVGSVEHAVLHLLEFQHIEHKKSNVMFKFPSLKLKVSTF